MHSIKKSGYCLFSLLLPILSYSFKIDPRIINGENAESTQFPWQVAVTSVGASSTYLCSGVIIHQKWVLTVAQCINGSLSISVMAGSTMLYTNDTNKVTVSSTNYLVHEDYSTTFFQNDIGIIQLSSELPLNSYIQPIVLFSEQVETGTYGTVCGWGRTSDTSEESSALKFTTMVTISEDECATKYGILDEMYRRGKMCAIGDALVPQGVCDGDSGSPFVVVLDSQPMVAGLVSFANTESCEIVYPAGFTKIDYYREWIRSKTGI